MNSPSFTTEPSKDALNAGGAREIDALEEPWFDAAPPSSQRPSAPPFVHVGEFLGDPEVDAWLR